MSLLYHPLSRSIMQRNVSGCLTPNNQGEAENSNNSNNSNNSANSGNSNHLKPGKELSLVRSPNKATTILSPPLSPYQRNSTNDEQVQQGYQGGDSPVYLESKSPFKVENYKAYELTLNPWNNLNMSYKKRQFNFLEQYLIISAREQQTTEKRPMYKRRHIATSDSDSESAIERIRTRRLVKESSANLSEIDSSSIQSSPTPKKKKVRRDNYAGSPLALHQQSLIDENIPDYSPETSTLPKGNNKCLKVEWKGQPMDLRNDPNLSKLHPAEVLLASILRLPCNVYLDSKRRLFYEKVNRLRNGVQFRRTDAQKACRIDVNKASRLFAAFEKVGWLDDYHFSKYL